MIRNFKQIGEHLLEKDGFFETQDEQEKRKTLLNHQTLKPYVKKDKNGNEIFDGKALCLNFDLNKDLCEFKMSEMDLEEKNKTIFFSFPGVANASKKFLSTNDVKPFYLNLFDRSLKYIKKSRSSRNSKEWFKFNISKKYDELLEKILDSFFVIKFDNYFLNYEKLIPDQKIIFLGLKEKFDKEIIAEHQKKLNTIIKKEENIEPKKIKWLLKQLEVFQAELLIEGSFDFKKIRPEDYSDKIIKKFITSCKEIEKSIGDLFAKFLNTYYFNNNSKKTDSFPPICIVLINNQHILKYNEGALKKDYVNLCYYDFFNRFFIEESYKDKTCHICSKKKDVIQNIPFPLKFYGTTNLLNFENLDKDSAYRSFAICKNCLLPSLTGMKYIEQYFSKNMFNISYYLIPQVDKFIPFKIFERINDIFKRQKQRYTDDINFVKNALSKARKTTARFDMLFFFKPSKASQQFDVLQAISNIDFQSLLMKLELLDLTTEKYGLDRIGRYTLTIHDLRFYLFPSIYTVTFRKELSKAKSPNSKIFSRDLLNFLTCFLNDKSFNYKDLINRFVNIYKKRLHKENDDILSPLKMNLFLSIMLKLKKIKGGNSVKTGESISSILKKEYEEFFETHHEIYFENAFRQGLFLLGTIISKIKFQQKGKKSDLFKKLNFSGIPPRRLPSLIGQVKDFSLIYKVYEEPGIWGNLMDRLQGIQTSGMKPDEILFYILSGISFEDYLGIKFGYEEKLKNNGKEQGEDNDN